MMRTPLMGLGSQWILTALIKECGDSSGYYRCVPEDCLSG